MVTARQCTEQLPELHGRSATYLQLSAVLGCGEVQKWCGGPLSYPLSHKYACLLCVLNVSLRRSNGPAASLMVGTSRNWSFNTPTKPSELVVLSFAGAMTSHVAAAGNAQVDIQGTCCVRCRLCMFPWLVPRMILVMSKRPQRWAAMAGLFSGLVYFL